MDPIRFAIDNPVKVLVGVILLMLFGILAVVSIPVQLTPNVDPTVITVSTNWTGKSPEEVEKEIVEQQEDVFKNLSGLQKMTATATQGQSEIELEFGVGVDLQEARALVSDALREVPSYQDDVDEPVISTGEAGPGSPIAWLLMTSEDEGFDVQSLGDLAIDYIKPTLERSPGVSEVRIYGGREREVHVEFDPMRVAQRQLTVGDLGNALRGENVNVSAGNVDEGRYDVRVRTVGQYDTLDAIRQTVVAYDADGGPILIEDVATVTLTYSKRRSFVRSRGELALAMPVYRESGSNVIEVMEALNVRLDEVNEEVLPVVALQVQQEQGLASAPKLHIRKVYDETGYIYDALDLVKNNLIIGGVLAILALLLFLELGRRPLLVLVATPLLVVVMLGLLYTTQLSLAWWVFAGLLAGIGGVVLYFARPTAVVGAAIPISIIGTFVVMFGFGRNLNVISLAGLAFAVGMVVDNAIVVLENIDRHLAMGKKRMAAAYDAGREVWGAIFASTLTTLAVFLPILFIEEEAGQLFRDIALALCAAVSLSLIVSITVIPTLSARMLRERHDHGGKHALSDAIARVNPTRFFAWVTCGYAQLIYKLTSRHPSGVVGRFAVVAVLTVVSLMGAWQLMPATDYLPRGNKNLVFGIMINPPGYNITTDEEIAQHVESQVRPYWEADHIDQLANHPKPMLPFGGGAVENVPPVDNYFIVSFNGTMFNGATSKDKENIQPLEGLLGSATSSVPGSVGFAQQSSLFGRGAAGSRSIDVEVRGADLDEVRSAATALLGELRGAYGFGGVQPTPLTFDKPRREVVFRIDRVKAADLGVDVEALGRAVAAMVDGLIVGDYRYLGDSIDIVAKSDGGVAYQPEELAALPVAYRAANGETGRALRCVALHPVPRLRDHRRALCEQRLRRSGPGHAQRPFALPRRTPHTTPPRFHARELHGMPQRARRPRGDPHTASRAGALRPVPCRGHRRHRVRQRHLLSPPPRTCPRAPPPDPWSPHDRADAGRLRPRRRRHCRAHAHSDPAVPPPGRGPHRARRCRGRRAALHEPPRPGGGAGQGRPRRCGAPRSERGGSGRAPLGFRGEHAPRLHCRQPRRARGLDALVTGQGAQADRRTTGDQHSRAPAGRQRRMDPAGARV